MFNLNKAFEVDTNGLQIEDGAGVLSGSIDPVTISNTKPCFYFRTNGSIYYHTGIGTWQLIQSDGGSSFDEDLLLFDETASLLVDNEFNALRGV